MREETGGVGGWVRELIGSRREQGPRFPADRGERCVTTGLRALVRTDAVVGSVLFSAIEGLPVSASDPSAAALRNDTAAAIAAGYGAALTGRRVSVIVSGEETGPIVDRLERMVERHAPLLLYVVVDEPSVADALVSVGAPVALAVDPAHAIDLALTARRLAESALTPVVVLLERDTVADAFRDLRIPPSELIEDYLGSADDRVDSPTPAQVTLFGDRRRRVPRWFDPGRPTAHGLELAAAESAAGAVGRELFFGAHVGPLLDEAAAAFEQATGRLVKPITTHGASRPRHWLITRGGAVAAAATVVGRDRDLMRSRFAVLGRHWFLPAPWSPGVPERIEAAESVTVLDRGEATRGGWTSSTVEAAKRAGTRCFTAVSRRLDLSQLAAACRNALAGDRARPHLELDVRPSSLPTEFPRRQAMLDRVRRQYPGLDELVVTDRRRLPEHEGGIRTWTLYVESFERPERLVERISTRLDEDGSRGIRGRIRPVERGLWEIRVGVGLSDESAPVLHDAPTDVLLLGHVDQTVSENPLLRMTEQGIVVIASSLDATTLAASLPEEWRAAASALDLRFYRIAGVPGEPTGVDPLLDAGSSILSGSATDDVEPLPRETLVDRKGAPRKAIPMAIRRFGHAGESFDNLARFWSEMIEPRMTEPSASAVPDPYLAAAAVPACSSSFGDASFGRETMPSIDPSRCTGCGRCWESCPDSAIGAVALPAQQWLDAVADRLVHPAEETEVAGRLRRTHKQLAARLETAWIEDDTRQVPLESWREAFDWVVGKLGLDGEDAAIASRVRDRTLETLAELPLTICDIFFGGPRREGEPGALLMLSVNPMACQGCGICAEVCPDEAVSRRPQTGEAVRRADRLWHVWEELPDTAGATIARLSDSAAISPLAAILLSRDCALAVTGRGAEPGSGDRLAVRQVAAVVEYQLQRRLLEWVRTLEDLERRLRSAMRETLGDVVEGEGLERLAGMLDDPAVGPASTVEAAERAKLREKVASCRRLERCRRLLVEGEHGLGRARYSVVLDGKVAHEWARTFPLNPFSVPVVADLSEDGADVARGLASATVDEVVSRVRLAREAETLLENPPDLPERRRRLEDLAPRDLSAEELAATPPVVVLADGGASGRDAATRLLRRIDKALSIKLLLLDPCELDAGRGDPVLEALARRGAFVLSTSIADPRHLFGGVSAALRFPGPAVIRIHAPSPRRHGFDPSATIERAREAVTARVQPLLRYDPRAAGVFGTRIDLSGNPAIERTWVEDEEGHRRLPSRWARSERRFRVSDFPPDARDPAKPTVPGPNGGDLALGGSLDRIDEAKAAEWQVLQELAGIRTPFTEALEARIREQLRAEHESELETVETDYRSRLDTTEREQLDTQARRLRRRLMQLAGYES